MKKKLLSSILALSLAFSAVSCGKKGESGDDGNTVKIAYLPITHSLAVLEEAEELEEKSGVKVELVKYGSWAELLDALNSNRVDGASVLIELAMKSKQEGIGLKAVALGHRDGNVIVVSNPTEMPSALASGQIDGYCVAEPFGAMGVSLGAGKVLFSSEELWEDSLCCGLVLTDKFIDERPDDAKEFVESYKAAGNALDKEKAKETAKKYLSQSDEVLDISLRWISYNDLDITEDIYSTLVEKVKAYGLSDNPPAYGDFVKNDF